MPKLPEHERPPVETLERFLAVSPALRRSFLNDLQNDCACPTESYEVEGPSVVWGSNGPEVVEGQRVIVPLHDGVLTDSIVQQAVEMSGGPACGVIVVNLGGWGLLCTKCWIPD